MADSTSPCRSTRKDSDRRDALRDAMKMQLGLKLVKTKVALPTLIIEHAEAPAEH